MKTRYEMQLRQRQDARLREFQAEQKREFDDRFGSLFDRVARDGIQIGYEVRLLQVEEGIAAMTHDCTCQSSRGLVALTKVGGMLEAFKEKYHSRVGHLIQATTRSQEKEEKEAKYDYELDEYNPKRDMVIGDEILDKFHYRDSMLGERLSLYHLKRLIDAATILHESSELIALRKSGPEKPGKSFAEHILKIPLPELQDAHTIENTSGLPGDQCYADLGYLGRMMAVFGLKDIAYVPSAKPDSDGKGTTQEAISIDAAVKKILKE